MTNQSDRADNDRDRSTAADRGPHNAPTAATPIPHSAEQWQPTVDVDVGGEFVEQTHHSTSASATRSFERAACMCAFTVPAAIPIISPTSSIW